MNRLRRFGNAVRARSGITMLEILIAIAILSFCIVPIIMIYRYTGQANFKSVNALNAANLAADKIEEFKYGGIGATGGGEKQVEFRRLRALLETVAASSAGFDAFHPGWKPYELIENYDQIPSFPNFQRYVRVSFFPMESPDPTQFGDWSILAPEYVRLTSRIQIYVEVTWCESIEERGRRDFEKKYRLYTIVADKE